MLSPHQLKKNNQKSINVSRLSHDLYISYMEQVLRNAFVPTAENIKLPSSSLEAIQWEEYSYV